MLGELLLGFFTFFTDFDFETRGVSLHTGEAIPKQTEAALFVEHFFHKEQNICQNVTDDVLASFRRECSIARSRLENSLCSKSDSDANWGILGILDFSEPIAPLADDDSQVGDTLISENIEVNTRDSAIVKEDTDELTTASVETELPDLTAATH